MVFPLAQSYLQGLVLAGKRTRNMARMAEVVPDTDAPQFQHFLSNSPWAEAPVIAEEARRVNTLLWGQPDSGLLQNETPATKKGKHSVGVARPWNGRLATASAYRSAATSSGVLLTFYSATAR